MFSPSLCQPQSIEDHIQDCGSLRQSPRDLRCGASVVTTTRRCADTRGIAAWQSVVADARPIAGRAMRGEARTLRRAAHGRLAPRVRSPRTAHAERTFERSDVPACSAGVKPIAARLPTAGGYLRTLKGIPERSRVLTEAPPHRLRRHCLERFASSIEKSLVMRAIYEVEA